MCDEECVMKSVWWRGDEECDKVYDEESGLGIRSFDKNERMSDSLKKWAIH